MNCNYVTFGQKELHLNKEELLMIEIEMSNKLY